MRYSHGPLSEKDTTISQIKSIVEARRVNENRIRDRIQAEYAALRPIYLQRPPTCQPIGYILYSCLLISANQKSSPCPQIKAAAKQDRKKFKNMDVTGIVSVQCSHVLVKASVDLQLGERFANVDYALVHALQQTRLLPPSLKPAEGLTQTGPLPLSVAEPPAASLTCCDLLISYDISCSYSINAYKRFCKNFPHYADVIKDARWLIPLVHVSNHKEDCEILYSSAYQENAAHFHGETAEQTWAELNHVGAQTRQMNNGHRQDVIAEHHGDWNWKKVVNIAMTLRNDILIAEELVYARRTHLIELSKRNIENLAEWNKKDRYKWVKGKKGQLISVFREHEARVPSQTAIYNALISQEQLTTRKLSSSTKSPTDSAMLINEGIQIQKLQRKIRAKLSLSEGEKTGYVKKEIANLTRSLLKQLGSLRNLQKGVSPSVGDAVAKQVASKQTAGHPEQQILFLPSDFSLEDQARLGLLDLAAIEQQMREGEAFDAIRNVQTRVKFKDSLITSKSHDRGQAENSATITRLGNANSQLNLAMNDYHAARAALISLEGPTAEKKWQPLTIADTYRKSTRDRRQRGDSKAFDGSLWHMPDAPRKRRATGSHTSSQRQDKRLRRGTGASSAVADDESKAEATPEDGWIWSLRQIGNLSEKELEEWLEEKDRVQFYRAEAEMMRWLEQWEAKQAELLRTIRHFNTLSATWTQLGANHAAQPGHLAYALKTADMYHRMAKHAQDQITDLGYTHLLPVNIDGRLLSNVMDERRVVLGYDKVVEDVLSTYSIKPPLTSSVTPTPI